MPRAMVAILTTFMLALGATPVRSVEPATADDTARFLAGLSPSSNSPLAALTNDPAWPSHARYFDCILRARKALIFPKSVNFQRNT